MSAAVVLVDNIGGDAGNPRTPEWLYGGTGLALPQADPAGFALAVTAGYPTQSFYIEMRNTDPYTAYTGVVTFKFTSYTPIVPNGAPTVL